jgi:hypothetical protein
MEQGKTRENRYELVEMKRQYKAIMEKEKKEWQGRAGQGRDNIKTA